MKLCRFHGNRIGLVEDDQVWDVTAAFEPVLSARWPWPPGDPVIAALPALRDRLAGFRKQWLPLASLRLDAPVGTPSRILAAASNFPRPEGGPDIRSLGFLVKVTGALAGPGEDLVLAHADPPTVHETELVVVVGKAGRRIPAERALGHVAGYAVGLDMTLRGTQLPSFGKSPDGYAVVGPWLVTPDEIADPARLKIRLTVNGAVRQEASTGDMILGVAELIALASAAITLQPGDILFAGNPPGAAPVAAGDVMEAAIDGIGGFTVRVRDPS